VSAKSSFALLFVIGLICSICLVSGMLGLPRAPQAASPGEAQQSLLFSTSEQARTFILARMRAHPLDGEVERVQEERVEGPDYEEIGDPYTMTYLRMRVSLQGKREHYFLSHTPERELALARAFAQHGFLREALSHYHTLTSFHPDTAAGKAAAKELPATLRASVVGLVPVGAIVYRDAKGKRLVAGQPGPRGLLELAQSQRALYLRVLDRIQQPTLSPVDAPSDPVTPIGAIDEQGQIVMAQGKTRSSERLPGGLYFGQVRAAGGGGGAFRLVVR